MTRRLWARRWIGCALWCAVGACSKQRQLAPEEDAGEIVVNEASLDTGARRDVLGLRDTGAICDPVECNTCRFLASEDLFQLGEGEQNPLARSPSIAGNASQFAVVYASTQSGFQRVQMSRILVAGGVPVSTMLSDTTLTDKEPAVAALADRFVVAWSSNRFGGTGYEILTRAHGLDGMPMGDVMRITNDARTDVKPALAASNNSLLLSWTQLEPNGGVAPNVYARTLGMDGAVVGPLTTLSLQGRSGGAPSVATRVGGFAVSYSDLRSTPAASILALLNADGTVQTPPQVVSTAGQGTDTQSAVISESDVAIAAGEGTALYGVSLLGVRSEIRARSLLADGRLNTASLSDRTLTEDGEQGADPGVTRFSGGYVIAYRARTSSDAAWRLRIAFVQTNFNVVRTVDLAPAAAAGGHVRVFAYGVNFVVAWYDVVTEGTITRSVLRAARVRC